MRTDQAYLSMAMLTIVTVLFSLPGLAQIEINDINELQLIGNDVGYPLDGDYILGNDIDASGTGAWNSGAGFIPIAPDTNPVTPDYQGTAFTGTFDGAGYIITNLTINRPTEGFLGLFGYADGATLQNIALENVDISGADTVGGLVGYNEVGGSLTNCYSAGSVSGDIVVGGLVGYNVGDCTLCYSTGTVTQVTNGHALGGLVGVNGGSITICYSTGTVTGYSDVGGLAGVNIDSISNCYSTGTVIGNSSSAAGLVGLNGGTITNCYSTGSLIDSFMGAGLVGMDAGGSVSDCYWDMESSGVSTSDGGIGKTTAEMIRQATFVGWDFSAVWILCEGVTYPWLQNIPAPYLVTQPTVTVEQGASQSDPTDVPLIVFDVVFDAPTASFDDSDLDFSGSTAVVTNATVINTGDNMAYTVEVTLGSEGFVRATIPADTVDFCGLTTNLASTSTDNIVLYNDSLIPGSIGVTDSISPFDDFDMPFGPVSINRSVAESVTITNTDSEDDLILNSITLSGNNNYTEDFSDGLAEGWVTSTPANWSVQSESYQATANLDETSSSIYGNQTWKNCEVEAAIEFVAGSSTVSGLFVRASDDFVPFVSGSAVGVLIMSWGEYYISYQNEGTFVQGNMSIFGSFCWAPGYATNVIRLNIMNDALSLYCNGHLVRNTTHDIITDSGKIGLLVNGASSNCIYNFDNISVTDNDLLAYQLGILPVLPIILEPLESLSFNVIFTPEELGIYLAKISIDSNDIDTPLTEISLGGLGIETFMPAAGIFGLIVLTALIMVVGILLLRHYFNEYFLQT